MEIGDPSEIVKLPRSQIEHGRTFYSQVWSLNNSLKRKRQEICVAVDGDSINVYEVNNGRNLNSCTIPPDCALSCPPYPIRMKSYAGEIIRCIYYVATRRNTTELSVFQEVQDGSTRRPFSRSVTLESGDGPAARLDILPSSDSHHVLVVTENGQFSVYNADLSICVKRGRLNHSTSNARFVTAQWISSQHASRSILKARPDLLATSGPDCSFIVGVLAENDAQSSTTQSIGYGVWQLSSLSSSLSVEQLPKPILYYEFPISSPLLSKEKDPIVIVNKDTRLLIRTQSSTSVVDLTPTTPHIIQETSRIALDQLSSIYLSDSLTLLSTSNSIQLQNTQFKTLLTKLDLKEIGLKRKRNPSSGNLISLSNSVYLIAFFLGSSRALAKRRDHLVTIDLHVAGSDRFSTATKQSTLLVNNIGRGVVSQERLRVSGLDTESLVGQYTAINQQVDAWHKSVEQLEQYVQQKDFKKFEEICLEVLNLNPGNSRTESPILSTYKVDYILSKLFKYEGSVDDIHKSGTRSLKLVFPALNLLGLLATAGCLTAERLSKALRTSNSLTVESIEPGSIPRVLIDNDQSLNTLLKYLEKAPHIAYQELCATLLLLLRRALAESSSSSPLAVTTGQPAPLQAESAIDLQPNSSRSGGTIASNTTMCLCTVLERLAGTAQSLLSTHMRNLFDQEEIVALIQFLRQQLFHSGYTRSLQSQLYPSPPASENESSINDDVFVKHTASLSLDAMASILSVCMDVVGPLGILSFSDEEEFTQTLIPDLSSEVNKATEAVQDAVFLSGILRETLRFAESSERARTQKTGDSDGADDRKAKPGAVVTLYSEPILHDNFDQSAGFLPLGLRPEGRIDSRKVRKGDGKLSKRSDRDMGMHQDRLRGPYAFERLVL